MWFWDRAVNCLQKKSTKDVLQRKREDCSKCQDVSLNFGNDSML